MLSVPPPGGGEVEGTGEADVVGDGDGEAVGAGVGDGVDVEAVPPPLIATIIAVTGCVSVLLLKAHVTLWLPDAAFGS